LNQASRNAQMGVPCEFVVLNSPAGHQSSADGFAPGVDFFSLDASKGDVQVQLVQLRQMLMSVRPCGATPLRQRLQQIQQHLQINHASLIQQGRRIVLVMATDGLPTSAGSYAPTDIAKKELVYGIREITVQLPVFVVIRLCTDEDDVVNYYNVIDEEEELPLEVIDDLEGEAREAQSQGNGWLTYSEQIHYVREGGTFMKLFDLLDERRLTPLEVRLLAGHVLQAEDQAPLLLNDDEAFMSGAAERLKRLPVVYNPIRRGMQPAIDMRALQRAVRKPHRACQCLGWLALCR